LSSRDADAVPVKSDTEVVEDAPAV